MAKSSNCVFLDRPRTSRLGGSRTDMRSQRRTMGALIENTPFAGLFGDRTPPPLASIAIVVLHGAPNIFPMGRNPKEWAARILT